MQHPSPALRKNTAAIAKEGFRVFSIDLLGYGYSDKPDPRELPRNALYNFETWGRQVVDFLDQVVQGPASLVCNSVGGLAGLDAAIRAPGKVPLVMLLDISLRMLHAKVGVDRRASYGASCAVPGSGNSRVASSLPCWPPPAPCHPRGPPPFGLPRSARIP